MFNKAEILNKIKNPEQKMWFAQALEQAYFCMKKFEPAFTDFSDPYKTGELLRLLGANQEFKSCCFGGFDDAERVMIGFFPDYMEIDNSLFPIGAINISYNKKFSSKLKHRDFLGAVLSLGIKRDKIGDIIIDDGFATIIAESKIVSYIMLNLEKVANTKVCCKKIKLDYLNSRKNDSAEKNIIVSSLRLDAVLSAAFGLSRNKTNTLISSGMAFINWQSFDSPSKNICQDDVVTLRGFGRIKIIEIKGKTKKDKFLLNILKNS